MEPNLIRVYKIFGFHIEEELLKFQQWLWFVKIAITATPQQK